MSSFRARTRLRGAVDYYNATWLDGYFGDRKWGIKFEEGPNKGKVFREIECAIAQDTTNKIEVK